MVRRADHPQATHHIPIYNDDWEYLVRAYGANTATPIGPGPVVRNLVRKFVQSQKALEAQGIDKAQRDAKTGVVK